jgi:CheY-like chemotaxis protein
MPEVDGIEATAAVREKEKATGAHVPIVAMTAHAMKGDRERCLAAGMDGYVAKPLQPAELFAAVEGSVPPPPPASEPPNQRADEPMDRPRLLARMYGDKALLKEIVGLFLDSYAQQLSAIREAIAQGDSRTLSRAAHALKSPLGNLCARAAFATAQRLETLGRQGDLTHAAAAYAALDAEIQRLVPVLRGLQEEGNLPKVSNLREAREEEP